MSVRHLELFNWTTKGGASEVPVAVPRVWGFATGNLSPWGEQQLVDFQIFKSRVNVVHTTIAQHIFYKLKVCEFVDLATSQICVPVHWVYVQPCVEWPAALDDS